MRKLVEVKIQAAPALLALLADESATPERRKQAARVLSHGQPSVIEAIPTLVKILEDKAQDPDLRAGAAWSLRFTTEMNMLDVQQSAEPQKVLRPNTDFLVPVLVGLVEDTSESKHIRSQAALALGGLGPEAHVAMPTLLASIHDNESQVRAASVSAIGDIGIAMPEVIPMLISALHDGEDIVRISATEVLGKHESKSDAIVTALRGALENDSSWMVRQYSVNALTEIGFDTEGVVPALVFALRDEQDWVRRDAAIALGKAGPRTPEVIPALIVAAEDEYAEVKGCAARALALFGPQANQAIPALTRALLAEDSRSEDLQIEPTIVDALRSVGADMSALVPSLEEALNRDDYHFRNRAAWALAAIGSEGLPALANALTVPDLLAQNELGAKLSIIDYPLDTPPNLSPEELQALIHHYTSERDRQAASMPDEPDRWTDEQDALLYLATLEREQKASALAAARDAANVEKFLLPPTLLAFVAPVLVVLVLLAVKLYKRSRSARGL
jgi:HEAT repeat protein